MNRTTSNFGCSVTGQIQNKSIGRMKVIFSIYLFLFGASLWAQIDKGLTGNIEYFIASHVPMYDSQGELIQYLYTGQPVERLSGGENLTLL
jgi:hypothetical protein